MELFYKDFIVRNAVVSDSVQLARWWNDGDIMAHAGFPDGTGETVEEIREKIKQQDDHTHRNLMIEKNGVSIGEMFYGVRENGVEIGIKICDFTKHHQGFGKIVLSMLIKHLLFLGYEKIMLDTNVENRIAQHVYEVLGFRKVGVRWNAWKDQRGNWQSSVDYVLDADDFQDFTVKK